MSRVDTLMAMFDRLTLENKYKFAEHVRSQTVQTKSNLVCLDTGYTKRLVSEDLRSHFLQLCDDVGIRPILITDALWGKGCYYNITDQGFDIVHHHKDDNRTTVAQQLPEELRQLFIEQGTYGRVFFEILPSAVNFFPSVEFVSDLDYCHVFSMDNVQTVVVDGRSLTIYYYDTESG